jgi:hypothetical protein
VCALTAMAPPATPHAMADALTRTRFTGLENNYHIDTSCQFMKSIAFARIIAAFFSLSRDILSHWT